MTPITNMELYALLDGFKPGTVEHTAMLAEMKARGYKDVEELADATARNYGTHKTVNSYIRANMRRVRPYTGDVELSETETRASDKVAQARSLVEQAEMLNAASDGLFTLQIRFCIHAGEPDGTGVAAGAIRIVSEAFGISPTDIFGLSRCKTISTARIMAFAVICCWLRDMDALEVVERYLNRRRFCAYYYTLRHEKYMKDNNKYKQTFNLITKLKNESDNKN